MSTPETQQGCIPLVKITAEQKSSLHNEIRPTTARATFWTLRNLLIDRLWRNKPFSMH